MRCEQEHQLQLVGRPEEEGSEVDERGDISPQGQMACWEAEKKDTLRFYMLKYCQSGDANRKNFTTRKEPEKRKNAKNSRRRSTERAVLSSER